MTRWNEPETQFTLPKPGRALRWLMLGLFFLWLMFAVAVNWGGASLELFLLFTGNTDSILGGQVWRLFTAPFMHYPEGNFSHILWVLVGLYFLTPSLEERWGSARLLRFLFFSTLIAYALQMLAELVLPSGVRDKLIPQYWFGAFPAIHAVAIAWALSFRGQVVRLMFVLPVSSTALIVFIVSMSLLRVIVAQSAPEGLLSPFFAMFAGWLLGAGTPSPLRRAYLRLRLQQLDREARSSKPRRVQDTPFSVIEGGLSTKKRRGSQGNGSNGRSLH